MIDSTPEQKRRSILMIVVFTVLAAIAQPLFKTGAAKLFADPTLMGVLTNYPLIIGLTLYGLASVLMILALRHGELSVLYPIISLSYVWVAILSVLIFHESMKPMKIAAMAVIITGVGILGRGGQK